MATGYRIDSSVKKREIDEKLKNVESLVDNIFDVKLTFVPFSQKLSCDLL